MSGPAVVEVARGETVSVTVVGDVKGDIHVHGYDLFFAMTPGHVVEIVFEADVAGIFEVEIEQTGLPLFDVEVSG